ncbi:amidase family protein [Nevskia ramosa]|uniref:amidase family protein n=1 Tax=Nevskia ramosa TaxID=64002 RepID=UPI003D12601B
MLRKGLQIFVMSALALSAGTTLAADKAFHLQETSIEQIHAGIRSGEVSCKQIVEAYVARSKAYNGVCTALVTADGAKAKSVLGTIRGGAAIKFPTKTVAFSSLVPDFSKYKGDTPDYGHMEATMSDPSVFQQYGMVAGIPNAKQISGLDTINLRGERSVSCKAECDAATGALPASCPKACDSFRQQPDAIERAAELDKQYGKNPDLAAMPMYCVPMSFKAIYDAKDMRSTGGADAKYAMDAAPKDSTLIARMRSAGAIIFAHALNAEYNGGSGDPGGANKVKKPSIGTGGARETWGGTTCNPYDTERETGGSSGGSGTSVAANLVVCSICETTGGSCRNPGTHNGVVNFVPTKGMISFGGAIGANPYQDRPGIHCKTVADTATVMDAFRDSKTGSYFDARDPYTSLPRVIATKTSYKSALTPAGTAKPLAGLRIGVVRELMVKHTASDGPIVDGINRELQVLKDLGAELVETVDPQYPDDPSIPNLSFGFQEAMAEVLPFHMPEVLAWKKDGKPEFEVPGWDVSSRKYLVAASNHKAPWPAKLNLRRIIGNPPGGDDVVTGYTFSFNMAQYLNERGDSTIHDWDTLNANAKYFSDAKLTAAKNWGAKEIDIRTYDTTYTMKRRDAMRMVMMKVMEQNKIDVFVNPPLSTPPAKIGAAAEPDRDLRLGFGYGARLGIPEVHVPAGFLDTLYEATFVLSKDGSKYESVAATKPTKLSSPLPFDIAFWAGPGEESMLFKVASAYEAATHHRKAPPAFGPLAGEP